MPANTPVPATNMPKPTAAPAVPERIALSSDRDGNAEIYVINADGSGQTRLTYNPSWDESPSWSPDGTRIAFQSYWDGNREIYVMNADGSGLRNLTNHPADDTSPCRSPDAKRIGFSADRGDYGSDIYAINTDGSALVNIANSPGSTEGEPSWSP